VRGQPVLVPAIAAEDEAAEFALPLSAGVLRGDVAEVESWADVRGLIGRAVVQALPARVAIERVELAVVGNVVEPNLAATIGALAHIEQSEAIELRPVRLVTRR